MLYAAILLVFLGFFPNSLGQTHYCIGENGAQLDFYTLCINHVWFDFIYVMKPFPNKTLFYSFQWNSTLE